MSRYTVTLEVSAAKAIRKLDPQVRRKVLAALAELGDDPYPPGVKAMVGSDQLRIRVARDYRIVYRVRDAELRVFVVRAGHRREVYRDL